MHIAPYDNKNSPIVDVDDTTVPLNYFNIVKLNKGQALAMGQTCFGEFSTSQGAEAHDS